MDDADGYGYGYGWGSDAPFSNMRAYLPNRADMFELEKDCTE